VPKHFAGTPSGGGGYFGCWLLAIGLGDTFWREYGYICHRKWSANRMQSQVYLSFAEVKPTFALQISETTETFLSIKGYLLPIRVPEPASQVPLSVVSDISDDINSPEPPCCQKVYPRSVLAEQRRVKERRFPSISLKRTSASPHDFLRGYAKSSSSKTWLCIRFARAFLAFSLKRNSAAARHNIQASLMILHSPCTSFHGVPQPSPFSQFPSIWTSPFSAAAQHNIQASLMILLSPCTIFLTR
jgi:hypothetical protein